MSGDYGEKQELSRKSGQQWQQGGAEVSAQPRLQNQPGIDLPVLGEAEQSSGKVGTSQIGSLSCSVIPVAPAALPAEPGASPTLGWFFAWSLRLNLCCCCQSVT